MGSGGGWKEGNKIDGRSYMFMMVRALLFFSIIFFVISSLSYSQNNDPSESELYEGPELADYYPELIELEEPAVYFEYKIVYWGLYEMPDYKAWAATLELLREGNIDTGYIKVWFADKKPRFLQIMYDELHGSFYSIQNNRVETVGVRGSKVNIMFGSEMGIVRWVSYYKDGLLRKQEYYGGVYRIMCEYAGLDSLWSSDKIEYWKDTIIPSFIYHYYTNFNTTVLQDTWLNRDKYDRHGKWIKTTSYGELNKE